MLRNKFLIKLDLKLSLPTVQSEKQTLQLSACVNNRDVISLYKIFITPCCLSESIDYKSTAMESILQKWIEKFTFQGRIEGEIIFASLRLCFNTEIVPFFFIANARFHSLK